MQPLTGDRSPRAQIRLAPPDSKVVSTERFLTRDPYSGCMGVGTVFKSVSKALGPFLLGFGTIFQPKANVTDHWSTTPQVTIRVEASADESGDPAPPDEDRRLTSTRAGA